MTAGPDIKAVVDSRLVVHGGHDGNKWVADMHILASWQKRSAGWLVAMQF